MANSVLKPPIDLWGFTEDADASCAHVADLMLLPGHTHTHTGIPAWAVSVSSAAEVVECSCLLIKSNFLILQVTLGLHPFLSLPCQTSVWPSRKRVINNPRTHVTEGNPEFTHAWGQTSDTPIFIISCLCHKVLMATARWLVHWGVLEIQLIRSLLTPPWVTAGKKKKKKIIPWLFSFKLYTPAKNVSRSLTDIQGPMSWMCWPDIASWLFRQL